MRGLAEFVMSGRRQAITAVVLLGLVPLINLLNPVMVGLVVLRRGWQEAALIFIWALMPLFAWSLAGDFVPLLMLLGLSGLAVLLRETGSWEFTLLAAVVVGAIGELYFRLQPEPLMAAFDLYASSLANPEAQLVSREEFLELMPSTFGAGYMALAIGMLITARWLQATLYNPGGFRQEFHQLRLGQTVALLLVGMMLLTTFVDFFRSAWVMYFAMPLLVAGLALVHAIVAKRQASGLMLLVFYLILPWAVQFVVLLALVDSWFDIRARVKAA